MKTKNLTQFVSITINPTKITLLFISFLACLLLGSLHLYNASAQSDAVSFGDGRGMQMIDPDGTNSVPFWSFEDSTAEFTLYHLPTDRFLGNYPRLSRYSGSVSWDTEGLTIQQTWTATNTVESQFQMWSVPLPEDTPSGIYIIKGSADGASADSMIVVGRNTLLLKQGNNGQVVAWASALQSGAPAVGMEVTLYNIENGTEVAQGVTNEMGVVELNSGNVTNVIAIGQTADETTLAATDEHWRSYSNYYWQAETPENYRIYLYTDRPIYRPGHTIQFDTVVRSNTQDGYSPIAASTVMTATLRDPRNTIVDTVTLKSDELGTAHDQFVLGDEPPLGSYSIELQVGDQIQRQELKVEEYSKPEYNVEVSTPKNFAILGDTVPVTVDANYFFGQPVADAKVLLKVYRSPIYHYWWWWEEDGYTPYWVPTGQVNTYAGTTDSDGRWTLDFEPPSYDNGKRNDARYRFEAEVTDAQEKPISGQASVRVYWNTLSLNVSGGKYGYRTDEPISLEWQAQDRDGVSVANQVIDVRLEKDYYDRNDENDAIQEHQITTNDLGKAALSLENVPQGWYRILATTTDEKGRQVEARRYLWVYNPTGRDWWYTNDDQISIMVDKESYSVGDTAQLLIQSRVEKGVALLTLEREGVHQEQIVNIDGPMTTVDVPITEDFTPNVFARIHLFKPHSFTDFVPNREGEMFTDQVELKVPTNAKRLTVDIRTDAPQYKPGEEAEITIQLSDAGGQPTAGRVTLALVDEAIFALQSDLSADIFDSFYGPGVNRVGIYESLVRTPYYSPFTMLEDEVADGEIMRDEDASIPSPAPTTTPTEQEESDSDESSDPRTTFLDTAYWEAGIVVGDDGTATVTIPLPDNLTTWRIIVRAVTPETHVGEATENLLVTKEIISRPTMPRFTVLGDVFNLNVVGQNFTGDDLTGEVSIKTDHLVILNDQPSIALNLPNKGSDVAPWTAVASRVGTGMITTTLDTPRGNDTVVLPLLTKPFAIPDRWSASGQANPSATETFSVPFNAVHEASELNVRLSPSIALGLLDGLDDLIAYPYGCVEQTMSRVLPGAVAIQVYSELELSNPKATELPAIINKGLQKLYGYQHDDGRWGWFYDDDGGIYLTSYVLLGLTRVQKAGFPVDQAVLDKGFASLDNALRNSSGSNSGDPEQRQDETSSNGVLAFAHYVKALGDSFDESDVDKALALADSADSLRADSLGLLALALHSYDETEKANAVIDVLSSRAEEIGSTAFWPVSEDNWDWYHWRTMASTDKSTAVAVLALSTVRPESELLPKAVRWLMDHRRGAGWRNTQATAFAVLGLLEYIKVSNELESNYSYTVALNGDEIASGQVTPENVTQPIEPIAIPGDALKMGDNEIAISRSPGVSAAALDQQNPLYYTVLLQQQLFYENFAEVSSKDQGLALKRSYSLVEGEKRDDGHYNVGDVVEVTLELEISDEVWYLLVRDPLPAGFEALNENLNPTSYGSGGSYWRSWGYNRKDVRDDSVDFFITHGWAGGRTLTYRMRATTAGTFSVLPAEAYPMYAEEIWGRSGSMQVSIAPERLDPRPTFVASDVDRNCRIERFDTLQVVGAWGTPDEDGMIHLDDIAEVASLQGSDCMNPAATTSTGELPAGLLVLVPQRQVEAGEEVRIHIIASSATDLGGIEMKLDFDETVLELEEVILNPAMGNDVLQLGPKTDEETGDVLVGAVELPSDDGGTVQASMANAQTVMTVVLKGKADGAVALDISDVQAMDSQGQMMVASSSLVHRDQLDKFIYLPMIAQGGAAQK